MFAGEALVLLGTTGLFLGSSGQIRDRRSVLVRDTVVLLGALALLVQLSRQAVEVREQPLAILKQRLALTVKPVGASGVLGDLPLRGGRRRPRADRAARPRRGGRAPS